MKRRKGRRAGGIRRDRRCRTIVIAAAVTAIVGLGGPAWALWSASLSLRLREVHLGTVAFAVKGQKDPARTISQSGEPVAVEVSGEQIAAAYANPSGGVPTYWFDVSGWADGANGLDYTLEATLTGPAVAAIDPQILVSKQCTPLGLLPWWRDDGYIEFSGNHNARTFQLQAIGKPNAEPYDSTDRWCISFPINAGQYVNHAEATGHWIDENNTFWQVAGQAEWNTDLIRTPDTVKGAHLTVTTTPIVKGK